ncbi:MAG: NfeD family protein [Planctomycetota bacterium]|jgi:membrane-bound serine protease (ClpP class)
MVWWLVFAVFLYLACAALIVAEVFVPSGGLISIFAIVCLIGGAAIFFHYSVTAGWIGIGIAAVMIPTVLVFAYRIFPKTRFGKSVTLTPPKRRKGDAIPDTPELKELLGVVGVVLTPLRPVGMCDLSGQRVECVAESGYVEKGKKVKVIDVESTQLTVRIIEEDPREAGIQS